jgi:(2Fe-2S) ferredoxin
MGKRRIESGKPMEQRVRRAAILLGAGGRHNLKERQRVRALTNELAARRRSAGETVVAAFITEGKSDRDFTLAEAVAHLAAAGATDIVVVPYLLEWHYPEQYGVGDQLRELAPEYPSVRLRLARAMGGASELADVLHARLEEAWAHPDITAASVREIAEIADQSPVTKATLRDSELPRLPAHAQHVLLCHGRRCMELGSPEAYRVLMATLEARGLDAGPQRVKVTRTTCLSPCQAAPTACVYPSGAFYAELTPEMVPAFVEQVLVEGGDLPGKTFHPGA